MNTPLTSDGGHDGGGGDDASGGMAAQSKRKVWGQEARPTTHSNKQADRRPLRPFPLVQIILR
ncbi:MAG: hypothetical protein JRJ62_16085 [Deltaproteobacteria bacterium]|nr:hypothetical protein [Deltaproteobacteria bacterium]